jgi:hypothetical protein
MNPHLPGGASKRRMALRRRRAFPARAAASVRVLCATAPATRGSPRGASPSPPCRRELPVLGRYACVSLVRSEREPVGVVATTLRSGRLGHEHHSIQWTHRPSGLRTCGPIARALRPSLCSRCRPAIIVLHDDEGGDGHMSWGAAAPAVSVCGAPDPPACVGACGVSIVWDIVLRPVFVISLVLRAAAYGGGARRESACVAAPAVHAAAIATAGSFLDPAGLFCGARGRQMAKWPGAGAYARCDRTRQRPGSSLPSGMVGAGRGAASPARRVGGIVARGDWCVGGSAIWRGCSHGFVLWLLPAVPQVPSVFMPGTSYLLLPSTLHPRRPFPNSTFCRRPRDCDRGNTALWDSLRDRKAKDRVNALSQSRSEQHTQ